MLEAAEDGSFRDTDNQVQLTIRQESDTLFYVKRIWKNISDSPAKIQTVFRVRTCYTPERYLIPCVNVNGNVFGNGGEPKGMERTGKIMDYLAFSSYKDVLPVLQTNLCYKGVSDPTDIEMMNILLETETVDLGDIYNLTTSFTNDVCGTGKMLAGNNTFASELASITEQVESKIQELFEE